MPHRLARLPLTALATGLAAGAALAVSAARAAEPAPSLPRTPELAYVLEGLDGPDLVTVPSPSVRQAAPAPPLPLPQPDPAEVRTPVLPQGPMPDGSTLAARMVDEAAPLPGGEAELPPLDPAQPAVADAQPPPRTVLSKLDLPGPVPARRPVAPPPAPAVADTDAPDLAPAALAPATPEGTESLTEAIIASLKGNPEIQISLAQQDDARYAVNEARASYLPRIDVTGAWGREFARTIPQAATQRFRSEATISLNQNLWDFGVTINDIKRARASYRSAQWGTRERIEAISYDIANAYLGVLLQQNLVTLAEGEIASVRKILRIVTVQKDLGLTTPADVERAQTRLDNVRSQLLDRKSALEQARNAYKRLTDHMPLRAAEVPAAGAALPESADIAVDLIDTRSPRLAQAVEDRRSLDKQYDSQADTALPRLGLTIASDYRQDVLGATGRAIDARAMVTFSYRLYNGGAATATKRRIAARLRQADYELDRRRREVEQDIRIDYASLGAAREKIATIEAEIASAQRVADLYKQQFRGGRRTVFDLLDAEQLLFAAKAKQTANQIALRAAEYRVLQKLGGLFDLVSGGQPLPDLAQPAPGGGD
ncbi:TolC family outer membrane protein [Novosphingobium sp.]|uniref:TolC family outer membrane protein n=1 Tax=Novosphingobium sp. TaxID=1874826 RepID=UPI003BA8ADA7